MAESKRRGRKTNNNQMEMIVNFIKTNKIFNTVKCHPSQPNELDDKWEQLTTQLNLEPGGANKTSKQWRTFVSEWKSRVRKKARIFQNNLVRTGGGGYFHRDLSELENQLMGAIGWLAITGNEKLPPEIDPEESVDVRVVETSKKKLLNFSRHEDTASEQLAAEQLAADQFAAEEYAVAEAEERHLPENVSARGNRHQSSNQRQKRRQQRPSHKSQLQKAAELYSTSAAELTSAMTELSGGMFALASAINNMADALKNTKL